MQGKDHWTETSFNDLFYKSPLAKAYVENRAWRHHESEEAEIITRQRWLRGRPGGAPSAKERSDAARPTTKNAGASTSEIRLTWDRMDDDTPKSNQHHTSTDSDMLCNLSRWPAQDSVGDDSHTEMIPMPSKNLTLAILAAERQRQKKRQLMKGKDASFDSNSISSTSIISVSSLEETTSGKKKGETVSNHQKITSQAQKRSVEPNDCNLFSKLYNRKQMVLKQSNEEVKSPTEHVQVNTKEHEFLKTWVGSEEARIKVEPMENTETVGDMDLVDPESLPQPHPDPSGDDDNEPDEWEGEKDGIEEEQHPHACDSDVSKESRSEAMAEAPTRRQQADCYTTEYSPVSMSDISQTSGSDLAVEIMKSDKPEVVKSTDLESSDQEDEAANTKNRSPELRRTRSQSLAARFSDGHEQTDTHTEKTSKESKRAKMVSLDQWIFQIFEHGKVRLEGQRRDVAQKCLWHSTYIVERKTSCLLVTDSGSIYRLVHGIDVDAAYQEGLSKSIVREFHSGFPSNWQQLITKEIGRQLGLGQKKGDPTAQKRGRSKNNYKASAKNSNDLSTGKDSKDTKKPRNKQTSATRSIAVTPARPRSLRMSLNTTCDNVKGSIEDPLNLSDLPMTRSGRRVKPQLAWWAGQRLMYIPKCDAVDITPLTPTSIADISLSSSVVHFKEDKAVQRMIRRDMHTTKEARRPQKRTTNQKQDSMTEDTKSEESVKSDPQPSEDDETSEVDSLNQHQRQCRSQTAQKNIKRKMIRRDMHKTKEARRLQKRTTNQKQDSMTEDTKSKESVKSDPQPSEDDETSEVDSLNQHQRQCRSQTAQKNIKRKMIRRDMHKTKEARRLQKRTTNQKQDSMTEDTKSEESVKSDPQPSEDDETSEVDSLNQHQRQCRSQTAQKNIKRKMIRRDMHKTKEARRLQKRTTNQKQDSMTEDTKSEESVKSDPQPSEDDETSEVDSLNQHQRQCRSQTAQKNIKRKRKRIFVADSSETDSDHGQITKMALRKTQIKKHEECVHPSKDLARDQESQNIADGAPKKMPERLPKKDTEQRLNKIDDSKSTNQGSKKHLQKIREQHGLIASPYVVVDRSEVLERQRNATSRVKMFQKQEAKGRSSMSDQSSEVDILELVDEPQVEKPHEKHQLKEQTAQLTRKEVADIEEDQLCESFTHTPQTTVWAQNRQQPTSREKPSSGQMAKSGGEIKSREKQSGRPNRHPVKENLEKYQEKIVEKTKGREVMRASTTNAPSINTKTTHVSEDTSPTRESQNRRGKMDTRKSESNVHSDERHHKELVKTKSILKPFMVDSQTNREARSTETRPAGMVQKETLRQNKKDEQEQEADRPWTSEELQRLYRALLELDPTQSMFWEFVAARVMSRTAEECQTVHQKQASPTIQKKSRGRPKKEPTKESLKLTAKVGTMKRKRQLRDILDHHDKDHEDDAFDSTPFKRTKTIKVPHLDEDDEFFQNRPNVETPSNFQTPNARSSWLPVSQKKTPHCNLISPGPIRTVERNAADAYIHHFKKSRLARHAHRPKADKTTVNKKSPSGAAVEMNVSRLFEATECLEDDANSDAGDYYFSDDN